jgi:hypothetical protein
MQLNTAIYKSICLREGLTFKPGIFNFCSSNPLLFAVTTISERNEIIYSNMITRFQCFANIHAF